MALTAVWGGCCCCSALGVYLLRNKRRLARHALETLIILDISLFLCDVIVYGFSLQGIIASLIRLVLAIALMVYIRPLPLQKAGFVESCATWRRRRAEEGTLKQGKTGKGCIELDFFNLFWIFVVCCISGPAHQKPCITPIVFGGYQDRAGVLYRQFLHPISEPC